MFESKLCTNYGEGCQSMVRVTRKSDPLKLKLLYIPGKQKTFFTTERLPNPSASQNVHTDGRCNEIIKQLNQLDNYLLNKDKTTRMWKLDNNGDNICKMTNIHFPRPVETAGQLQWRSERSPITSHCYCWSCSISQDLSRKTPKYSPLLPR